MKLTSIVLGLAAATPTALATPGGRWHGGGHGYCLSYYEAETIVNKFISILENVDYKGQSPAVTAKQVVAEDYIEYSDSILSLEGAPVRIHSFTKPFVLSLDS